MWYRRFFAILVLLVVGALIMPWWASEGDFHFRGFSTSRRDAICPWGIVVQIGDWYAYQVFSYRVNTAGTTDPLTVALMEVLFVFYNISGLTLANLMILVMTISSLLLLIVGNSRKSPSIVAIVSLLLFFAPVVFYSSLFTAFDGKIQGGLFIGFYLCFAASFLGLINVVFLKRRLAEEEKQSKEQEKTFLIADSMRVSAEFAEIVAQMTADDIKSNLSIYRERIKKLDLFYSHDEIDNENYAGQKKELQDRIRFLEKMLHERTF